MIVLNDIIKRIDEELNDAEYYAERSNEKHEAGDDSTASEYRIMSNDELRHAIELHRIAVNMIEEYPGQPTQEMLDKWKASHKTYIGKTAMIRSILEHVR